MSVRSSRFLLVLAAGGLVLGGLYRDTGRIPAPALLLGLPLAALLLFEALRRIELRTTAIPFLVPAIAVFLLLPYRPNFAVASSIGTAKHALALAFATGVLLWFAGAVRALPRPVDAERAIRLLLPFLILTTAVLSLQPPGESDEADYLLLAESLRSDGDIILDDEYRAPVIERLTGWLPNLVADEARAFREGSHPPGRASYRAPLGGLLLVPGLYFFDFVHSFSETGPAAWFCLYLIPTILLWRGLAGFLRAAEGIEPAAFLGVALAPPVFYYASQTQPEVLVIFLLGVFFEGVRAGRSFAPAAVLALLPLAHYRLGILSLLLLPVSWAKNRRLLSLAGVLLGGTAAGTFILASEAAHRGGILPALASLRGGLEFGKPIWGLENLPRGIYFLLLSPRVGAILAMPILCLSAWGCKVPRARPYAFAAVGYLLFMAGYRNAQDSFPYARYMIPAVALLLPAILAGSRRLAAGVAGRRLLWGAADATALLYLTVCTFPSLWRMLI